MLSYELELQKFQHVQKPSYGLKKEITIIMTDWL